MAYANPSDDTVPGGSGLRVIPTIEADISRLLHHIGRALGESTGFTIRVQYEPIGLDTRRVFRGRITIGDWRFDGGLFASYERCLEGLGWVVARLYAHVCNGVEVP